MWRACGNDFDRMRTRRSTGAGVLEKRLESLCVRRRRYTLSYRKGSPLVPRVGESNNIRANDPCSRPRVTVAKKKQHGESSIGAIKAYARTAARKRQTVGEAEILCLKAGVLGWSDSQTQAGVKLFGTYGWVWLGIQTLPHYKVLCARSSS